MNDSQREIKKAYEVACEWLRANDGIPHASERLAIFLRNLILQQRHEARDEALALRRPGPGKEGSDGTKDD